MTPEGLIVGLARPCSSCGLGKRDPVEREPASFFTATTIIVGTQQERGARRKSSLLHHAGSGGGTRPWSDSTLPPEARGEGPASRISAAGVAPSLWLRTGGDETRTQRGVKPGGHGRESETKPVSPPVSSCTRHLPTSHTRAEASGTLLGNPVQWYRMQLDVPKFDAAACRISAALVSKAFSQ